MKTKYAVYLPVSVELIWLFNKRDLKSYGQMNLIKMLVKPISTIFLILYYPNRI